MTWTFPKPRRRKRAKPDPDRLTLASAEEQLPTVIQGKPVGSKEEARVAVALEILGWQYIYQRSYFGGAHVPGGIVVDFIVLTPITSTPLWVNSRYWHVIRNRRDKDIFQRSRLDRLNGLADSVEVWDYELQTIDQAIRTLLAVLGRA